MADKLPAGCVLQPQFYAGAHLAVTPRVQRAVARGCRKLDPRFLVQQVQTVGTREPLVQVTEQEMTMGVRNLQLRQTSLENGAPPLIAWASFRVNPS